MSDPFEDFIKARANDKTKKFRDALLFAKSEVKTESGRDFLVSCAKQFKQKGFLTQKQVEALYSIDSNYDYGYPDNEDDEAEDFSATSAYDGIPNR